LQPDIWVVGDGPARSELQSLAAEIYPEAQFLGELRGAALELYFARADLFVLPGTGGLAVQEAMSFGLPVIVAEGDGTQGETVRTRGDRGPGNGWIVSPNNDSALEQALRVALSDVESLRKMGAESYRIVAEEYNLENMVQVFVKALSTFAVKKN
jgi:glycosyltransferase involved in cell wall biosynthesis